MAERKFTTTLEIHVEFGWPEGLPLREDVLEQIAAAVEVYLCTLEAVIETDGEISVRPIAGAEPPPSTYLPHGGGS